jgi:hypothetical protein
MTEITGPVLHSAMVDCRETSQDAMFDVGIRLYRYQDWNDAETQYDTFEDLLIEAVNFHQAFV